MICRDCGREYDRIASVCPECAGPLMEKLETPSAAPPGPEAEPAIPFSISSMETTLSVSGASSIRGRLRPLSAWGILAEAFRLYRQNWILLSVIVLLLEFPLAALKVLMRMVAPGPHASMAWILGTILSLFLDFALVRAISEIYLGRRVIPTRVILPNSRFLTYVGVNIQSLLLVVLGVAVALTPLFVVLHSGTARSAWGIWQWIIAGLSGTAALVIFLVGLAWFTLADVAAVIEGQPVRQSLVRGWSLLTGFKVKAAGVVGATWVLGIVIEILAIVIFSLAVSLGMHVSFNAVLAESAVRVPLKLAIAHGAVILAGYIVMTPPFLLICVLLYYDLRVRKEGFDLQMLAEQLGCGVQS